MRLHIDGPEVLCEPLGAGRLLAEVEAQGGKKLPATRGKVAEELKGT